MCWNWLCPKKTTRQIQQDLLSENQSTKSHNKIKSTINPSLSHMESQQQRNGTYRRSLIGSSQHKTEQQLYGQQEQFNSEQLMLDQKERQQEQVEFQRLQMQYQNWQRNQGRYQRIFYENNGLPLTPAYQSNENWSGQRINQRKASCSQHQIDQQKQIQRLYCEQNTNEEFLYLNNQVNRPIFFSFRMKYQMKEPLEFNLVKHSSKFIALICKPLLISTKIDILQKLSANVVTISYSNHKINLPLKQCQVIFTNKLKQFNFEKMDKIFILTSRQQNFQQVKEYILDIAKQFSQANKRKLIYFFPRHLLLDQISDILFQIFKEEIITSTIQKNVIEFNFEIEFSDAKNQEYGIVVYFRPDNKNKQSSNFYYDHVKTSLVIFGKYPTTFYTPLRQFFSFIRKFSIHEVALLRKLFQDDKNQFFHRVRQLRTWDNYPIMNASPEQNVIDQFLPERYFKNAQEFRITKAFRNQINEYFETEQMKEPLTPLSAEWDDNLKQEDIKMAKSSLNASNNLRLDAIGNQQLNNGTVNLDIEELLGLNQGIDYSEDFYATLDGKYDDLDYSDDNGEFMMRHAQEKQEQPLYKNQY